MKSLLLLLPLALFAAACSTGADRPDTVVGVIVRCDATRVASQPGDHSIPISLTGDECDGPAAHNRRKVVTVRTGNGSTYTAEVPADTPVTMGQRWP